MWWVEVRSGLKQKPLVHHLALLLQGAFACSNRLFLALDAWLLVVLAFADLRENPRFFTLFLELLQSEIKWLIFPNSYSRHP